jgi:tetratricopeptide (TPR) repeat protein
MMLVENRLDAAAQHRESGKRENAAALYETVLDISPNHAGALQALAEIRLEEGDAQKASQLALHAAAHGAGADAFVVLATSLMATNKCDEACEAIEQALAIEPDHTQACQIRAEFMMRSGDVLQAEALLKSALSKKPDDPDLLAGLSGLYGHIKQARAALDLAQATLERAPDKPEYHALLGRVLADLGDHERALDYLSKAHLAAPTDPVVMLYLAGSQASLGLNSEARALAKRMTTIFPELLPAWLLLIQIETHGGDAGKVFAKFLQKIKQHRDKSSALIALASAYRIVGDTATALKLLQPLLEIDGEMGPQQRASVLALARDCMLSCGKLEDVVKTFPGLDLGAALGLPVLDNNGHEHLAAAFCSSDIFIEADISAFETIVLMRFMQTGAANRLIVGPAHLQEVTDLCGLSTYVPYDLPDASEPKADDRRVVSLAFALGLPAELLRQYQEAPPYIEACEVRRTRWRAALADMSRPLVALTWDKSRPGLLLDDCRTLFEGFEGTVISVVWDEARHQMNGWPDMIDAGVHFDSLADLAALLSEVDLVIGPDAIALHVAGAMARPATLLTRPARPWYWHHEEGRAKWYPSVHVVETAVFGNWAELAESVAPRVGELLSGLGDGHSPGEAVLEAL